MNVHCLHVRMEMKIPSGAGTTLLGMYLALDGNNKDQVKYIHKKATEWSTSIIVGGVQQNNAWKALTSTIPQTMKYPLSAMTLNKK